MVTRRPWQEMLSGFALVCLAALCAGSEEPLLRKTWLSNDDKVRIGIAYLEPHGLRKTFFSESLGPRAVFNLKKDRTVGAFTPHAFENKYFIVINRVVKFGPGQKGKGFEAFYDFEDVGFLKIVLSKDGKEEFVYRSILSDDERQYLADNRAYVNDLELLDSELKVQARFPKTKNNQTVWETYYLHYNISDGVFSHSLEESFNTDLDSSKVEAAGDKAAGEGGRATGDTC